MRGIAHVMTQTDTSKYSLSHTTRRVIQLLIIVIGIFVIVAASMTVSALTTLTAISQSYGTSTRLPLGALVSLEKDAADKVVLAVNSNVDSLLGVVVNPDNSLLSVSGGTELEAQIATTGTLQVLVSNINGDVKQGDYITASPVAGVGMKATGNVKVVGIAQGELVEKSGGNQTFKDSEGKDQTILVGQIPVLVNVSFYYREADKTLIPSAIQNIANAVAGRTVSPAPILT